MRHLSEALARKLVQFPESDFVQEVGVTALVIIDDDEDELGAKGYPSAFRT